MSEPIFKKLGRDFIWAQTQAQRHKLTQCQQLSVWKSLDKPKIHSKCNITAANTS